ncbi:unnamed protein product [Caretta caretta]
MQSTFAMELNNSQFGSCCMLLISEQPGIDLCKQLNYNRAPPKSGKSYQASTDEPNEGEENSAAFGRVALRGAPSLPAEHLTLKRRRKKRMREDMICEILHASVSSDHEQRAWRATVTNSMEKEREYKKEASGVAAGNVANVVGLLR